MFSFKQESMRKLVKGKHAERSSFLERKGGPSAAQMGDS